MIDLLINISSVITYSTQQSTVRQLMWLRFSVQKVRG